MDALQEHEIDSLPFEEQIAILMADLPRPLQRFLKSPERDAVSLRISQKHSLHADQAAAFERSYLYLLIGVNTPDEFVQDLRGAGITDEQIRGLTADVNEQVFKKLQQEERHGAPVVSAAPVSTSNSGEKDSPTQALQSTAYSREQIAAAYQRSSVTIRTALSSVEIVEAVRTIRTGHRLPNQIAAEFGAKVGFLMLGLMTPNEFKNQMVLAGAAPDAAQNVVEEVERKVLNRFKDIQASAPPVPVPFPPTFAAAGIAQQEAAPAPQARTMAGDMEAMLHPEKRQASVHPTQATPARSFQTASVPSTAPSQPKAIPTVPIYTSPAAAPAPAPHSEWKPQPPSPTPGVVAKNYNLDPYRELPE